ncbi:DUF7577 domain-containing protein [Humisphaera borealis]|uniref:DUF7577 domain-containing protein n=1 Tax=Humisphaera borealis TaxID=2807512 RepID=A0A7M2WRM7_9BACT|nr:zinc ribbon domain-containing protein [Humisphaera borealis]QOV88083.1 hypothetical protein IPV69_17690 [Humisphaera borealis]
MTTSTEFVTCPHCGAQNYQTAQLCHHCQMALPTVATSPRLVTGGAEATSSAGAKLQSDELRKQSKKATNTLLAVAILNLVAGAIFYAIGSQAGRNRMDETVLATILAVSGLFGALYFGLWFWARKTPFLPSLIGMIIYVIFTVVTFALNASSGKVTIPWLNIVIIALLVQGMNAAKKSDEIKRKFGLQ